MFDSLQELSEACTACTKCELYKTRNKVVVGRGNPKAPLLFVGEAPGKDEDLQGIPFVGRAGRLLDELLKEAGISENDYYIANILKCRPPNNRDPLPAERELCLDYLRNQFYLQKPKAIVCLGRIAAGVIIHPDFKITAERGKWFKKNGYLFMATFHPAALLRDMKRKPDVLADLKGIKNKISE